MNAEAILDDMDVVIEILIRLPPKSVIRFISVSKRWKNTITTDPLFLRSYSPRRSSTTRSCLLAFLKNEKRQSLIPKLPRPPPICFPDELRRSKALHCVYNSSNGLFLIGYLSGSLHVVNIMTRKWFTLPPSPDTCLNSSNGIMCEDNFSELKANYIVVRARKPSYNDIMQIETYSSRTEEWTQSTLMATGDFNLHDHESPTVANGVFHWNTMDRATIVVYDPNDSVKNHLQLIQKPKCRTDGGELTRSTTDDILWLFMSDKKDWKIFMLPKAGDCTPSYRRKTTIPHDEWVLMHRISHDSMFVEKGLIISLNPFAIVIGEGEVMFPYTLEKKLLKVKPHCRNLYPYFETGFLSTYALPDRMIYE